MSTDTRSTDDTAVVADGLHTVAIRMLRRLRNEDVGSTVGPARLSVLSILVFGGPSTVSELAAAEQVKPPTMSRLVAGLEREGLARRIQDSRDGRAVRVKPTPKGRRILEKVRARRLSVLACRLGSLSPEELAVVHEALGNLRRIFD